MVKQQFLVPNHKDPKAPHLSEVDEHDELVDVNTGERANRYAYVSFLKQLRLMQEPLMQSLKVAITT